LGPLEHLGIAWAMLVARTIKAVALGTLLHKRREGVYGTRVVSFAARLAISGTVTWLVLQFLRGGSDDASFAQTVLRGLLLPSLGAAMAFAASSYLLRIDECRATVALIRRRKAAVATLYGESP
jgi:hypothetical protein